MVGEKIFTAPSQGGGNHLIFANYKKAYGTRGYEASQAKEVR
jgi:hypothetical protein